VNHTEHANPNKTTYNAELLKVKRGAMYRNHCVSQTDSHLLLTAETRFKSHVNTRGNWSGKRVMGQVTFREFCVFLSTLQQCCIRTHLKFGGC